MHILFSGLLGVAGQLMLKRGLLTLGPLILRPDTVPELILRLALNPLVILGLCVYVSGTFFWLLALSRVDLGYAYPFASLNYVYVLVASWLFLGERPSPVRLIGVLAICLGVWAISRTPVQTNSRSKGSTPTLGPSVMEVTHR